MAHQWHQGMYGVTGMRLEALPMVFRGRGIPRSRQSALYGDIVAMQEAALDEYRKQHRTEVSE